MGVVGHGNWLLILQRARIQLLETIGSSFEELKRMKVSAFVRSVSMDFLAPTSHREVIRVSVEPSEITSTSLLLSYAASGDQGRPLIKATLRMVFVGENGRPTHTSGSDQDRLGWPNQVRLISHDQEWSCESAGYIMNGFHVPGSSSGALHVSENVRVRRRRSCGAPVPTPRPQEERTITEPCCWTCPTRKR